MTQAWQLDELGRFFELSVDLVGIAGFDGHFKRVGQAWERTLGYSREELLSRPFLDFVHPDDRERTLAESAHAFAGTGSVTFTNRYRCRDGSYRWIEWNSSANQEAQVVYFVARDITDRKRAEEALIAAEARFRAAIDGSLDIFVVLRRAPGEGGADGDFVFTEANTKLVEILSTPREAIIGRTIDEVTPEAPALGLVALLDRALRNRERLLEEREVRAPDGKGIWIQYQIIPLNDDSVAVTTKDITPFRQLEGELREALQRREVYAEELAQKNRMLAEENAERERAEALLRQQQDTMIAMSTPIIQAWEGVLVLPVIGTVETARAAQIMERLLPEIVRTQARFAVLDLTGVSAVDAATVAHLLAVVRAASLLGSRCLVSGISPAIARTMTEIGGAEGAFMTFGLLQNALRYALSRCGDGAAR
ncbi:anti-anti sigma factor protein [Sorangium cellulosum]|uniref:Anti-anti sigma factor protein n=1 Tax=Sorangium cellulosum TaxID=56 RepID=A0A2L0EMS3_SORCE|nr:PAS domain S-box protein [Sorangium cellulosum]AUX40597.1 anti-anti sigma factor protein [Sorangium cellulosum]